MPTLTATPDTRTGTVALNLSDTDGVTGILRSDLNGTRLVRLRATALNGTSGRTVTDHEPALSGDVYYRLTGAAGNAWTTLAGAELPLFIIPAIPQFFVTASAVTAYSADRPSRAVFHDVIGRAGPMVAQGRMGTRAGSMTTIFYDYPAAKNLLDVLERGQTVMFRQAEHEGQDMYFHAESVRITAVPEEGVWQLDISFREIDFPSGYVLSRPEWTFDALAKKYQNFDEVADTFATFHDLTIGER